MNTQELERAVNMRCDALLKNKGYISVVDVLIGLGYLSKSDYELWRFKKVPYLEKVCQANLKKLSRISKYIYAYSRKYELKKSCTSYKSYGKGSKVTLRFSKSNLNEIEMRYSTHHIQK